MIRYCSASKVNLLLRVGPPDSSGFHPVVTLLAALDLGGEVALEPGGDGLSLTLEGADDLGPPEANLVWRAVEAACTAWGERPTARLHLVKAVPHQAGLGGGSADAAAALRAARDWLRPELPDGALAGMAAGLGADVSFFLHGGYAVGRGRGERIEPVASDLRLPVIVWKPRQGLATGPAYAALDRFHRWAVPEGEDAWPCDAEPPQARPDPLARAEAEVRQLALALGAGEPTTVLEHVGNDFHPALVPAHAFLRQACEALERVGGQPLLSGSGSAVVGLFADQAGRDQALARLDPPEGSWVRAGELGGPGVARLG